MEKCKVLLVEDNPGDARLLREILSQVASPQFELVHTERLDEALKRLGEEHFDVVLLDLSLPDEQGFDTFVRMHRQTPGVPIVVLTGLDDATLADMAVREGAQDYLIKGQIDCNLLVRAMRYAIERERAEEALRHHAEHLEERVRERTAQIQAQYAQLEAILRSVTDGIIVINGEGEILQLNPVAQRWFTQTLSPDDATRLWETMRELARRAEERPETVLELTGLDLELSAAPVVGEGVNEPGAVVAVHDVSHLKALDRMKSRFITNVSHELRTPITTIKLYTALMWRQPEKWQEYLRVLEQEADHQVRLIKGILQISRIDSGRLEVRPQPTPLNELAETAMANYKALAQEQGLTLEHQLMEPRTWNDSTEFVAPNPAESPVALVDPQRMMQTLDNLIGNAIQYTPAGGRVMVSTGLEGADGRVWATVTVADTGIGIPEEELPHIFDRFFRGEEPQKMQVSGTGLGLTFVKEIVELHGGRVLVESRVGEGSTVTVWLPRAGSP
jgi:signal transduction histidine kinase